MANVAGQPRDLIGHWSKPQDRQRACPHKCCEWKHPHPNNLPTKLDRSYLRSLSEDQLVQELSYYQRYSDTHEQGYLQILAEDQRRTDSREKAEARMTRRRRAQAERQDAYRDEVYREWLQAENGIQGSVMLNRAGKRAGIDERSLFTGPESRVNKYASDELKEWFQTHPRPTRARILGKGSDRRERMERAMFGQGPEQW
jgi:hypothetical protein